MGDILSTEELKEWTDAAIAGPDTLRRHVEKFVVERNNLRSQLLAAQQENERLSRICERGDEAGKAILARADAAEAGIVTANAERDAAARALAEALAKLEARQETIREQGKTISRLNEMSRSAEEQTIEAFSEADRHRAASASRRADVEALTQERDDRTRLLDSANKDRKRIGWKPQERRCETCGKAYCDWGQGGSLPMACGGEGWRPGLKPKPAEPKVTPTKEIPVLSLVTSAQLEELRAEVGSIRAGQASELERIRKLENTAAGKAETLESFAAVYARIEKLEARQDAHFGQLMRHEERHDAEIEANRRWVNKQRRKARAAAKAKRGKGKRS